MLGIASSMSWQAHARFAPLSVTLQPHYTTCFRITSFAMVTEPTGVKHEEHQESALLMLSSCARQESHYSECSCWCSCFLDHSTRPSLLQAQGFNIMMPQCCHACQSLCSCANSDKATGLMLSKGLMYPANKELHLIL